MSAITVCYLDFWGTLLLKTSRGVQASPLLVRLLKDGDFTRVGILCNLPKGQGPAQIQAALAGVGSDKYIDSELVMVASASRSPLPDRRAFVAAAKVAGVELDECLFLSADAVHVIGALAAGMRACTIPSIVSAGVQDSITETPPTAVSPVLGAPIQATLAAGEIDEDRGPTYVLRGRIVTMRSSSEIFDDARIVISKGLIRALLRKDEPLPAQYAQAPTINTNGTIYPGLLDMHNHLVYDVLPLWKVPNQYENRAQWPREGTYKSEVSMPIKKVLTKSSTLSTAILRYVEAKAILGGTTTGQGILTQTRAGQKVFYGAMRNVEVTKDPRLPEASTRVPNLHPAQEQIKAFRKKLESPGAFFYHLSEGIDDSSRQHFLNLHQHKLVAPPLVGIHALALNEQDLHYIRAKGAKIVWSPFSNLLLYGKTLDLHALKKTDVTFCIGCDWSPTGSKNLLEELKIAWFENQRQGGPFSNFDLVAAVTSNAATTLGWTKYLGTLRVGAMADLLIIEGRSNDPFEQLINATESAVRLVTIHGVARYGDRNLLDSIPLDAPGHVEDWKVGGVRKAFYLYSENSLINDLQFSTAVERLKDAMRSLSQTDKQIQEGTLAAIGVEGAEELTLELDNEFEQPDLLMAYDPGSPTPSMLAPVAMAESVELDEPVVGEGDYFERVKAQPNISSDLKKFLEKAY